MPGGATVAGRARGCRLQHLHPGGVPLEGHVLIVCRFDQHTIAHLREHSLANVLVEEHFLVDKAEIVLDLGNVAGSTEDPLIRIELRRTLTDLSRLLGLRLVLEGERVNRTRRRILNGLRVNLLLLQTHLRNQRQVLLLLKPHTLVEHRLRLGETDDRLHPGDTLPGVALPWRIFLVESHLEFFTSATASDAKNVTFPAEKSPTNALF